MYYTMNMLHNVVWLQLLSLSVNRIITRNHSLWNWNLDDVAVNYGVEVECVGPQGRHSCLDGLGWSKEIYSSTFNALTPVLYIHVALTYNVYNYTETSCYKKHCTAEPLLL